MDEPSLPPMPSISSTSTRSISFLRRKRTHSSTQLDESSPVYLPSDHPVNTSSDPALFSSDEQTPGAENYVPNAKRKKRQYQGSWWDHSLRSAKRSSRSSTKKTKPRREFRRNFDSGIFIPSSGSSGSEYETKSDAPSSDSFGELEEELLKDQQRLAGLPKRVALHELQQDDENDGSVEDETTETLPVILRDSITSPRNKKSIKLDPEPEGFAYAREIIRRCLDASKEDVDLSSCNLSDLPNEISSLQYMTKQAYFVDDTVDFGRSLEPELRLYLSNNRLTKIPRSMSHLKNLKFLSLRNNQLESIPAVFRELTNLQSLNIAGNCLTRLPFEILELAWFHNLQELITHPNPWEDPMEILLGRDLEISGQNKKGERCGVFLQDHVGHPITLPYDTARRKSLETSDKVSPPSLTETILRNLAIHQETNGNIDLVSMMDHDTTPRSVLDRLQHLQDNAGDTQCTRCRRRIVIPGKAWLEWWSLATQPAAPYLRTMCHESCTRLVEPRARYQISRLTEVEEEENIPAGIGEAEEEEGS